MEQTNRNSQLPIEIRDLGAVTRVTRGSATLFPWYEVGNPPFNRRCITCAR